MKKVILILLPLLALFALAYALRTPDTDYAAMERKYTNEASRFVESEEGLRVHYRDQGNPDGIPIVFIHGTAASLHSFEPMVRELGERYRIIAYTQPGHGLTGVHPRDDYSFSGMAEALNLVTDSLGLDRFVLGGSSMGGWVSWRYALANPERIDALILLDASGMPLRDGEKTPPLNIGFKILGTAPGRFLMQHYAPRSLVEKSMLDSVSIKKIITDAEVDRYWEMLRLPGNRRAAGLRAQADRERRYADRINEITAPTLIIWGEEDQLIFASAAQTFDERLPNSTVLIYENVGHIPAEEVPARTGADIDQFLQTVFEDTAVAIE